MRVIITTFDPAGDDQVTFTPATTGPLDKAEKDRLHNLFRASAVVEVEVSAAQARLTLALRTRTADR